MTCKYVEGVRRANNVFFGDAAILQEEILLELIVDIEIETFKRNITLDFVKYKQELEAIAVAEEVLDISAYFPVIKQEGRSFIDAADTVWSNLAIDDSSIHG